MSTSLQTPASYISRALSSLATCSDMCARAEPCIISPALLLLPSDILGLRVIFHPIFDLSHPKCAVRVSMIESRSISSAVRAGSCNDYAVISLRLEGVFPSCTPDLRIYLRYFQSIRNIPKAQGTFTRECRITIANKTLILTTTITMEAITSTTRLPAITDAMESIHQNLRTSTRI